MWGPLGLSLGESWAFWYLGLGLCRLPSYPAIFLAAVLSELLPPVSGLLPLLPYMLGLCGMLLTTLGQLQPA